MQLAGIHPSVSDSKNDQSPSHLSQGDHHPVKRVYQAVLELSLYLPLQLKKENHHTKRMIVTAVLVLAIVVVAAKVLQCCFGSKNQQHNYYKNVIIITLHKENHSPSHMHTHTYIYTLKNWKITCDTQYYHTLIHVVMFICPLCI